MFITHQQATNTLNILCARHQKVIDESQNKNLSMAEAVRVANARGALALYNSLKQNYQTTV